MMCRWMAALLLLALLAGCARTERAGRLGEDRDVEIQLQLSETPTAGTPSTLEVTLAQAGAPVTGVRVEVEGAMSHAGMEPLLVEATEIGEGRYQALLPWTMGGEWIVTARATLPDGSLVAGSLASVQVASP